MTRTVRAVPPLAVIMCLCAAAPMSPMSAVSAQEGVGPAVTLPAPAQWRFLPSLALTYDSYGQRYELADEDTLDLVDEMSGQVIASLLRAGSTRVEFKNTFSYGEEAVRDDFGFLLDRRSQRFDLRLQNDARYKTYRTLSEYSLSSDYFLNSSRVVLTTRLRPDLQLRLDERFEIARVAERNRYNYDYTRNDVGLELDRRWALFSNLRAGYTFGHRSVPDSSAIDYRRHIATAAWNQEIGSGAFGLEQQVERRVYRDASVRSPSLDLRTTATVNAPLASRIHLRPEYRAWVQRYDYPDSIYADTDDHTLELLGEFNLTDRTTLGVGPTGALHRSNGVFEANYDQAGLKGTLSYLSGRLWLQFTNEFGFRAHDTDDEFYTDYVFNWTTLFLSYEFLSRTTFDLFFSLNPENHEDARNNTTTLLLSGSLTLALR
jgi:hypothetical protein